MKRKEQVGARGGQGLLTQCIFFMFIDDLVPKEPIDNQNTRLKSGRCNDSSQISPSLLYNCIDPLLSPAPLFTVTMSVKLLFPAMLRA